MARDTLTIRNAKRRDMPLMKHLQKKLAHAIGYMPPEGVTNSIDTGLVQTADLNDDAAGFILTRSRLQCSPTLRPIIQAAVHFDAQRRHIGLALVDEVARRAITDGLEGLTCWCAEELDANIFWEAAGFIHVGTRDPRNTRGRKLRLWRLPLCFPFQTTLVGRPSRAGFYAARCTGTTLTPLAVQLSQANNAQRLKILPAATRRFIDEDPTQPRPLYIPRARSAVA